MTLLVVDDSPVLRQFVKALLAESGSRVCECEDGIDALSAYRTLRPDLVLMDLEMSKLDGLAATRQILSQFPTAKIVVLTSHDDSYLRQAAQEAGACGYLLKDRLFDMRHTLASFFALE